MEMGMPGSQPEQIVLTPATRLVLEQLERWTFGQPISFRARIILAAADGCNNTQIARDLGISVEMVRLWRHRWFMLDTTCLDEHAIRDYLSDMPRPGRSTSHGRYHRGTPVISTIAHQAQ
jgi:hypothetical protein